VRIKMYNKAGSVLRIETTIAKTRDFKGHPRAAMEVGDPLPQRAPGELAAAGARGIERPEDLR